MDNPWKSPRVVTTDFSVFLGVAMLVGSIYCMYPILCSQSEHFFLWEVLSGKWNHQSDEWYIWRFPKIGGVPLFIIHLNPFHRIWPDFFQHPFWVGPIYGTPLCWPKIQFLSIPSGLQRLDALAMAMANPLELAALRHGAGHWNLRGSLGAVMGRGDVEYFGDGVGNY